MRPNIDFKECLKDSPRFRTSLEEAENEIDNLESKLEKVVKLCNGMIEAGKAFNKANKAFNTSVCEVADLFREDDEISEVLKRFNENMADLHQYHTTLLDQAHRSISKNINMFVKNDIKKVKDTRQHFEKCSDDLDAALLRNSQIPRSRSQDTQETHNVLTATRSCFAHMAVDYVSQINLLHSQKRYEVLHTMLSYMNAQNTYFHQGSDLFVDLDPYLKQVATQIDDLNNKAAQERKALDGRHEMVQKHKDLSPGIANSGENASGDTHMEGYLFKKTSRTLHKAWVRRWFMICNSQLVYRKRSKDTVTVMETDLRLCIVKPSLDTERRFCFEVVSPTKSHMMQADTDQDCQAWVTAIQNSVKHAYTQPNASVPTHVTASMDDAETKSSSSAGSTISGEGKHNTMTQILSIVGNDRCADCSSTDPRWASINLGITLCIQCSGIHRSLGVHISKVRSVTLDAWEGELLTMMSHLGNDVCNAIYEANTQRANIPRPTSTSNREERDAWIRAKYVDKSFVLPLPSIDNSKISKWAVHRDYIKPTSDANTEEAAQFVTDDVLVFTSNQYLHVRKHINVNNTTAEPQHNNVSNDDGGGSLSSEDDIDSDERLSVNDVSKILDISTLTPQLLLHAASYAACLRVMMHAIALGAKPNEPHTDEQGKMPLIKAVESGSTLATEMLLLNGAKVDLRDSCGRSALHHATLLEHTRQVCQFLMRNANQHALDEDGQNPLAIAVQKENADIVTLLRHAKMNEEMKDADLTGSDDTFTEVFQDFMTSTASQHTHHAK